MNENQKKSSFSERVLKRIKSEKVKMRPRIYFVLRGVFIALSIVFVAFFILYLVSFIFFIFRISGIWYLPRLGLPGFGMLFVSSPWILILIAMLLIVILEILVKRFSFAYRRPILYSILVIIVIIFLGSFIIVKTPLHSGFFWKARENQLPVIGTFYRQYEMPGPSDAHRGIISEITDEGFCIEQPNGQAIDVIIVSDTRLPGNEEFNEGDAVIVLGKQINETIKASGIIKADSEFKEFIRYRGPRPLRPIPSR